VDRHGLEFPSNEPIDGQRLADRLSEGALPAEIALRVALEIGTALHRAHAAGKIHGRVSPSAILLTGQGARLLRPEAVEEEAAAPYRSPEQVLGEPVDWRSDIFSYGSVLYAMVSGRPPFGTNGSMEEAIARRPAAALKAGTPLHIAMEGVIAGCMQKDPAARLQRMQNAVIDLKLSRAVARSHSTARAATGAARSEGGGTALARPASAPRRGGRRILRIVLMTLLVLAVATAAALLTWFLVRRNESPPVLQFQVPAPQPAGYCEAPAISPDGRMLACTAPDRSGKTVLWLRGLDETAWSAVENSEGAFAPFWGPDNRQIGFFANGWLKRFRLANEGLKAAPEALFETRGNGGGATWDRTGGILFAPGSEGGLWLSTATGGEPRMILQPRKDHNETAYLWPQFLPDGKHFVFFVQTDLPETSGVAAGALDSSSWTFLFASDTNAVYSADNFWAGSAGGFLLYVQDRNLRAREFNPGTLEAGESVSVRDGIGSIRSLALAPASASANGVLVYQEMGEPTRQLKWMNRAGELIGTLPEAAQWRTARISPDGRQTVLSKQRQDSQISDLWLIGDDGTARRWLAATGASEISPVWSPDGSRIAYACNRNGVYDIYTKALDGGPEELLYRSPQDKLPTDWAGGYILFGSTSEGTGSDIWALSVKDRRARPIVQTIHAEGQAVGSPDQAWLAYASDESGITQIYVQPFDPGSSETKWRFPVSQAGGVMPFWTRGGSQLVYMTPAGHFMAASVRLRNGAFESEGPQTLFAVRPLPPFTNLYSVSPNGERFLINAPLERPRISSTGESGGITVVSNWTRLKPK